MATINGSTSNPNILTKIEWSYTQSVTGNYSTVTATLYYKRDDSYTTYGTWSGKIYINGVATSGSKSLTIGTSWVKALSATRKVTHNDNGSKSITLKATGGISGTTLSSTTYPSSSYTLTTIPRASTISSITSSVTAGNSVTVNVSRKASTFYHKATFKISGTTKATSSAFATKLTYTVPLSWLSSIPNAKSCTVSVEVRTYTNSNCTTQVGSAVTGSFKLNSTSAIAGPTLDAGFVTVSVYNTGTAASGINAYLKGYSKAKVTFNASGVTTKYGATISRYEIEYNGTKDSASPYLTSKFTTSGTQSIICRVYDSRGYYASVTKTVSVYNYSKPTLSNITLRRTDSNGTADQAGTYLYGKATLNYSSAGGAITCTLKGYYRTASGTYGSAVNLTSGTGSFISSSLSPTVFYYAKIQAVDSLGSTTVYETSIKTKRKGFNFKPGGKAAAIFGYANTNGEFTVYGNVNALDSTLMGKSLIVNNAKLKKTLLSDANWSSGNLTITDISKYSILLFRLYDTATMIPCVNMRGVIRGGAAWVDGNNNVTTYSVSLTISGDVMTYVNSGYMSHTASSSHGAWHQVAITDIVGII